MTSSQPIDRASIDDSGQLDLPQFASVMRGYDRGQVDDYVARLNDFLGDAEQRANRAERSVADALRRNERLTEELRQSIERHQREPSSSEPYEGLGERVETILRLAAEEADALRQRGKSDADEMVEQARRRREQEVQAAEKDLAAVGQRRDSVVAELRKVQDVLATLGLRQAFADDADAVAAAAASAADDDSPTDELTTGEDDDKTTVIDLRAAAKRADVAG
jgi:DivIVA domain-containing protein